MNVTEQTKLLITERDIPEDGKPAQEVPFFRPFMDICVRCGRALTSVTSSALRSEEYACVEGRAWINLQTLFYCSRQAGEDSWSKGSYRRGV